MSEPHGNPSDLHSHAAHHVAGLPEPKTPMWLPALGAALFLMVGLLWAMCPSSSGRAAEQEAKADAGAPAP